MVGVGTGVDGVGGVGDDGISGIWIFLGVFSAFFFYFLLSSMRNFGIRLWIWLGVFKKNRIYLFTECIDKRISI